MNLIAILYASDHDKPEVVEVVGRLKHHGVDYRLYGGNGQWRGYGEQIRMAYEATHTLDCSHILFMNAFDVLCLAGPEAIMQRFLSLNSPWVFNAENNCYPDGDKKHLYPESPTPWRFLNSGLHMGERDYMATHLALWRADAVSYDTNDQRWFTDNFLSHPGVATLDTQCALFQSMLWPTKRERDEALLVNFDRTYCLNRVTKTEPLLLHYNGTGLNDAHFFNECVSSDGIH